MAIVDKETHGHIQASGTCHHIVLFVVFALSFLSLSLSLSHSVSFRRRFLFPSFIFLQIGQSHRPSFRRSVDIPCATLLVRLRVDFCSFSGLFHSFSAQAITNLYSSPSWSCFRWGEGQQCRGNEIHQFMYALDCMITPFLPTFTYTVSLQFLPNKHNNGNQGHSNNNDWWLMPATNMGSVTIAANRTDERTILKSRSK